ncbi:MAG: hypothetical protein AUI14_13975, partial [Actinobacteria bacterium 13_2_20CM_2_71_6]
PSTLLLATAMSGPALWHAAVAGDLDMTVAMERFLLAVAVSTVLLAALRSLTASYARHRIATAPVRAEDKVVDPPSEAD